jgi:hypothetical protein
MCVQKEPRHVVVDVGSCVHVCVLLNQGFTRPRVARLSADAYI